MVQYKRVAWTGSLAIALSSLTILICALTIPLIVRECQLILQDLSADIKQFKNDEAGIWNNIVELSDSDSKRFRRHNPRPLLIARRITYEEYLSLLDLGHNLNPVAMKTFDRGWERIGPEIDIPLDDGTRISELFVTNSPSEPEATTSLPNFKLQEGSEEFWKPVWAVDFEEESKTTVPPNPPASPRGNVATFTHPRVPLRPVSSQAIQLQKPSDQKSEFPFPNLSQEPAGPSVMPTLTNLRIFDYQRPGPQPITHPPPVYIYNPATPPSHTTRPEEEDEVDTELNPYVYLHAVRNIPQRPVKNNRPRPPSVIPPSVVLPSPAPPIDVYAPLPPWKDSTSLRHPNLLPAGKKPEPPSVRPDILRKLQASLIATGTRLQSPSKPYNTPSRPSQAPAPSDVYSVSESVMLPSYPDRLPFFRPTIPPSPVSLPTTTTRLPSTVNQESSPSPPIYKPPPTRPRKPVIELRHPLPSSLPSPFVLYNTITGEVLPLGSDPSKMVALETRGSYTRGQPLRPVAPAPYLTGSNYARPLKCKTECSEASSKKCPAGPKGRPGPPGLFGIPGPDGQDGVPGRSADNVAAVLKEDCFTCPIGPPGPKGSSGTRGNRGYVGRPGMPGMPGRRGRRGDHGEEGDRGRNGRTGKAGPKGRSGVDRKIRKGLPGPKGRQGQRGLIGNSGRSGEVGERGYVGYQGVPGNSGRTGKNGKPGLSGYRGPPGFTPQYCTCPEPVAPATPYKLSNQQFQEKIFWDQ